MTELFEKSLSRQTEHACPLLVRGILDKILIMHIIALTGDYMIYQKSPHFAIERFHLDFLRALSAQIDPALYVVKGGCNLRLCLGSVRCSEDLDIDVQKIAPSTLSSNVTKILKDRLPKALLSTGLSISQFSAAKQTDTVQRWKATLLVGGSPVPTKVEFSRRGLETGVAKELISAQVAAVHQVPPFPLPHYGIPSAVRQKAAALAGRALSQARDIFDLHFLFSQGGQPSLKAVTPTVLAKAAENTLTITYHDYQGQVVAYLPEEVRADYKSRQVWNQMQESVFGALDHAAGNSAAG
jgi:predicted nucleotidyltransferase component of viral defense system